MRLGIFLPNWIGDVVMATPVLRALRKHAGSDARLVGVMRPYVADVLAGTSWLDEYVFCEKRPTRPEHTRRAVEQRLRAARLDRVVLLTNSLRTAWMAWRSGAAERISFAGWGRSLLSTKRIFHPRQGLREVWLPTLDAYLQLATACGCPPESPRLELATTAVDEQAADAVWEKLRLPAAEQVVVLNSGGEFGGAKHWPVEHFAHLARQIVDAHGLAVLVNCGPSEREIAREIVVSANRDRVVSLADESAVPIGLTKACIRRCRLLVTTDSGPRFFGVAFGRPVVTLFGPTDPAMTPTHYAGETCLALPLECHPCMSRTCPLGHHRCMKDLSVDTVYRAARKHLENSRAVRSVA